MMLGLSVLQWIVIGVAAVVLLLIWGKPLLAWLGSFKLPAAAQDDAPKLDDDALDLQAFRRLQARFVRLKCKEGQDAMETAGTHFLHGVGGP